MKDSNIESKQKRRPAPPSHAKILAYWFDIKHESVVGWESFDNIAECSLGHAFCWACGVKKSKIASLDKCHILPYALGGSNEPSNFFLMCGDCHDLSPDSAFPDIFFRWVRHREAYTNKYLQDILDVMQPYMSQLNDQQLNSVSNDLLDTVASSFEYVGSHGGKISRSTVLGLLDHSLSQVTGINVHGMHEQLAA